MKILSLLPPMLTLAGCVEAGPRQGLVVAPSVAPGVAICLDDIGRPDVASDPEAPMSKGEIGALIGCTADRAGG